MSTSTERSFVKILGEACSDAIAIEHGWAPNIPGKPCASKLARITFLSTTGTQAVFWLWRKNADPDWQLVQPWHWAPLAAAMNWRPVFVETEPENRHVFLTLLEMLLAKEETPGSE